MKKPAKRKMEIKLLKAAPLYGLRRGEIIELEIVERKNRTTVFFEPPLRRLELFNEDWVQIKLN